jgi:uncharacterized protein YPO0396
LTVCSAGGWDREVERHQARRQRLRQLLEQLGESEPADAIRVLRDGKARRSSSDTLTGVT